MSRRYFLGIDPGVSGAFALIDGEGKCIAVWDAPRNIDDAVDLVRAVMVRAIEESRPACTYPITAVLERAFAMSGQTAGDYIALYGAVQALLAERSIPRLLVTAAKWKKDLGIPAAAKVPRGAENASALRQQHKRAAKEHSRALARRLFPDAEMPLQKHDGRAEALLIAEWGRRHG